MNEFKNTTHVKQSEVIGDEDFITMLIGLRKMKSAVDRTLSEGDLPPASAQGLLALAKAFSVVLRNVEGTVDRVTKTSDL